MEVKETLVQLETQGPQEPPVSQDPQALLVPSVPLALLDHWDQPDRREPLVVSERREARAPLVTQGRRVPGVLLVVPDCREQQDRMETRVPQDPRDNPGRQDHQGSPVITATWVIREQRVLRVNRVLKVKRVSPAQAVSQETRGPRDQQVRSVPQEPRDPPDQLVPPVLRVLLDQPVPLAVKDSPEPRVARVPWVNLDNQGLRGRTVAPV